MIPNPVSTGPPRRRLHPPRKPFEESGAVTGWSCSSCSSCSDALTLCVCFPPINSHTII